jgi:hypothetical protein
MKNPTAIKRVNTAKSLLIPLRSRKSTIGLKIIEIKMETASIANISANIKERSRRIQNESKNKK